MNWKVQCKIWDIFGSLLDIESFEEVASSDLLLVKIAEVDLALLLRVTWNPLTEWACVSVFWKRTHCIGNGDKSFGRIITILESSIIVSVI